MRPTLRSIGHYRPRALTLVTVAVIGALIVLANLSSDLDLEGGRARAMHGWPFLWHWHNLKIFRLEPFSIPGIYGWDYCARRLVAALVIWLLLLVLPAAICEWALRRYRPGPRWSLRTMLVAIALVSAGCGCYATSRNRANLQDPLIDGPSAGSARVWLKRPGPKWLDIVGPDRLRRYIVGAEIRTEEHLRRIATLPTVEYVLIGGPVITPETVGLLSQMRQVKDLAIVGPVVGDDESQKRLAHDCLKAVSQLRSLEHLQLPRMELVPEDLAYLAELKSLKSLEIDSISDSAYDLSPAAPLPLLTHLPALPRLEALVIKNCWLVDEDLEHLAKLPSLRALGIKGVVFTDDGLNEISSLVTSPSIQELALDCDLASPRALESLAALKGLRTLHLSVEFVGFDQPGPELAVVDLDNGSKLYVQKSDRDSYVEALHALREANPKVTIDSNIDAVAWKSPYKNSPAYHPLTEWQTHPDLMLSRITRWLTPAEIAIIDAQRTKP